MQTFLRQVAEQILRENPGQTGRVLAVFNNHRSELFLREQFKRISEEEGTTFFLPQTMVIDDLVARIGGLEVVQQEFLLFELYRIHCEMEGEERKYQSFEEFISFGDMMMSDFSEVDRYMVDAHDLFVNLHDLKAIGEWDLENPHMSEFQLSYLRFYHSLYEYYTRLRERLAEKGQAYSGMAYRLVAEMIKNGQWDVTKTTANGPLTTYFVGFNAMSECERTIIGAYVHSGAGHLITDGDSYYYSDSEQEAGYFLRKHSAEFDELGHYGPSLFATGQKKITIVECPENVMQCKFAGQLLSSHPEWLKDSGTAADSTAIVLADESLLIPTLGGLPDGEYNVNVTMGFAYADSHLHALTLKLLELYRRRNDRGYYHADVLEVLADHYIAQMAGIESPRATVTSQLERDGLVRVTAQDIAELADSEVLTGLMPGHALSPKECIEQVRMVVSKLMNCGILEGNPKERQAAGALAEVADYLQRLQEDYGYIQNIDTLTTIYNRIAQRHSIAFIGQPLSGLQVLGMLETRNLDFKRIILLSAGEGVLPAARPAATLIPHELKRAFNLPTYEERDCVYAYNFYRLLQRAEEIYLVYSSDAESAGKGEESRLLKQVRSELAKRFPNNIEVSDIVVDAGGGLHHGGSNTKVGIKTDAVMQRLYSIGGRHGFSPTSMSRYVECPLKYYYMSVIGLREQDALEDDIDASQLGETVHNILRDIYLPFVGKTVEIAALKEARTNIEALLDHEMEHLMKGGRSNEGRNSFLRSVAMTQLGRMLDREAALLAEGHKLEMVSLEQDYLYKMFEHNGHPICIGGRVDRIDRLDGRLRVIDYKTGSLEQREIAHTTGKTMPAKWLQLMSYALMYRRGNPSNEAMSSGIYPLRYLNSDVKLATWDGQVELTDALIDEFEASLRETLETLLNSESAFAARPSTTACRYCPAAAFCPGKNFFSRYKEKMIIFAD